MLQIGFIRQNADFVKERIATKYFTDVNSVDTIIALDEEVRKLKVETETIQAAVNLASKEIGMLMAKGEKDATEIKKQEVAQQKSSQQNLTTQLSNAEKQLHDELVKLPNLPHSSVPKGKTPEENEVVKEAGIKPTLSATAVPHWELLKKYQALVLN